MKNKKIANNNVALQIGTESPSQHHLQEYLLVKGDTMKNFILIFLIFINGCYTQRDRCIEKAREKSDSPCWLAIGFANSNNTTIERGRTPSDQARQLTDFYLIQCLSFHLEERNCEKKSEIIPEIGY